MAVTLRYAGKDVVTAQYPDAIVPLAKRYRGFAEYQVERCIACGACARACPVDCIRVEADGKGKTAVLKRYAIDYSQCMLCGLCVEVCPTECLHMGKLHDMSCFERGQTMVEFTQLARQGRRTVEPYWLAKAREMDEDVPDWVSVVQEHYQPLPPIEWGPVGNIDVKTKPPKSRSWA